MVILGHKVNPVLREHILRIASMPSDVVEIGNTKKHFYGMIKRLPTFRGDILVYNTSITNLILVLLLRLLGKTTITFHLHDPLPHSGWKNPIIFLVNLTIVKLSHNVGVFSNYLAAQTERYYGRTPYVLSHGFNDFDLLDYDYSNRLGIFGRNMPYKNFKTILRLFQNEDLVVVGKGYGDINDYDNIKYYDGFVPNDEYYSIMCSVKAVIVLHKKVSYSGVISDAMKLRKYIIGNSLVEEHIRGYDRFIHYRDYGSIDLCSVDSKIPDKSMFGWNQYRNELAELW